MTIRLAVPNKGRLQQPTATMLKQGGFSYEKTDRALAVPVRNMDLAVLFVDCCRAEGLAARFVSGYQKGNLQSERRHLHAWPEIYLPGGGWRGFDPTHGMAIADTHITVAAAADSRDTMPVSGVFTGQGASSTLDYELRIEVADESPPADHDAWAPPP